MGTAGRGLAGSWLPSHRCSRRAGRAERPFFKPQSVVFCVGGLSRADRSERRESGGRPRDRHGWRVKGPARGRCPRSRGLERTAPAGCVPAETAL